MSKTAKDIHTLPEVELPYGLKLEDYWHFMEGWEFTDEQKVEWVIALSHIIKGFVDWGVGQDSVQTLLAQKFVDNSVQESSENTVDSGNMLEQKNTQIVTQSPS